MNAQKYNAAIKLTTMAALKGGLSMAEVIGVLEMAKANVVAMALSQPAPKQSDIVHVPPPIPPGLNG